MTRSSRHASPGLSAHEDSGVQLSPTGVPGRLSDFGLAAALNDPAKMAMQAFGTLGFELSCAQTAYRLDVQQMAATFWVPTRIISSSCLAEGVH